MKVTMISEEQQLEYKKMNILQINNFFIHACGGGEFSKVKYLLTSPDLKENANIHAQDDEALKLACYHGHLEIVSYLLSSLELKDHANIHENRDEPLRGAWENDHVEIVNYLLTSPELKEHANIHAKDDYCFINACHYGKNTSIEYFIFECDIKKTKEIEKYLIKNEKECILAMFEKRELKKKLQNELKNSHYTILTKNKL